MKIAALAIAAVATFSPLVSGQFARVHNNCNFNAYVQSVPYDGSPAGDLTTCVSFTELTCLSIPALQVQPLHCISRS